MICVICGGGDFIIAEDFGTFKVMECNQCKFAIVDPLPSQEVLDELYNSNEYFKSHMSYDFEKIKDAEIAELVRKNKAMHSANINDMPINESKQMLEIGTGGGFALKGFEELGFKVEGVETSSVAAKFATTRLNLTIHQVPFEEFRTEKKYDLILLNHVLEHFMDVRSVTRQLISLLAPGGILYVRVPDHDSYDRRVYGKQWPAYAYYHISNFSKESLKRLFTQEGLHVLKVKKFFSEKSPLFVKHFLKKIIRTQSFLELFSGRTITILGQKL